MKEFIIASIGWILLLGIFGIYGYGLITAIQLGWNGDVPKDEYPEALSTAINSVQALLLTNMGALLGITITQPNSALARTLKLRTSFSLRQGVAAIPNPTNLTIRELIQLGALVIYVAGLIVCAIAWGHDGFVSDSTKIIDVVSTSGKMLIGVGLSYLAVVLS